MMPAMTRLAAALLLALTLTSLTVFGCDSDDPPAEGTVADTTVADAGVQEGPDIQAEDPCLGLKIQKSAAIYNGECEGIDKCTLMPSKSSGCWGTYCGPQGTKIVCVQAQCATPGGTP